MFQQQGCPTVSVARFTSTQALEQTSVLLTSKLHTKFILADQNQYGCACRAADYLSFDRTLYPTKSFELSQPALFLLRH
jgi:hypothetical protein